MGVGVVRLWNGTARGDSCGNGPGQWEMPNPPPPGVTRTSPKRDPSVLFLLTEERGAAAETGALTSNSPPRSRSPVPQHLARAAVEAAQLPACCFARSRSGSALRGGTDAQCHTSREMV